MSAANMTYDSLVSDITVYVDRNEKATRQYYMYVHSKPNGDIFYVGKGYGNRAYDFSRRNFHHSNTINKYGKENINVRVFYAPDEVQAFNMEKMWIKVLRKNNFSLVNQTDGGEGTSGFVREESSNNLQRIKMTGRKHSPETKAKLTHAQFIANNKPERKAQTSLQMRGNKHLLGHKHTEETLKKMSESHKGQPAWNKGAPHSAETKAKMSQSSKRLPPTNKGVPASKETKAKISASLQGNKFAVGYRHTEESKEKMRKARAAFEERKKNVSV